MVEYKEYGFNVVRIKFWGFKNLQDNELFEIIDKKGMRYDDNVLNDVGKDYVGLFVSKIDLNIVMDFVMFNVVNVCLIIYLFEFVFGFVNDNIVIL